MRVSISTHLDAEPQWVAAQLQSTAVFRHIAAPLLTFGTATGAPWPRLWPPGELHMHMRLLGLLPLGRQTVRICTEPSLEPGGWPALRDNGDGALLHRWDHRILLQPLPGGRTLAGDIKQHTLDHLDYYLEQFVDNATKAGSTVHTTSGRHRNCAIATGRLADLVTLPGV